MKFEHHVAYLYPNTLCETFVKQVRVPATSIPQKKTMKKKPLYILYTPLKHVNIPATMKKTSKKKPTINKCPVMVSTAIPAMAPGDKPGRAVVLGGKLVAVGGEVKSEIDTRILVYPTYMGTA